MQTFVVVLLQFLYTVSVVGLALYGIQALLLVGQLLLSRRSVAAAECLWPSRSVPLVAAKPMASVVNGQSGDTSPRWASERLKQKRQARSLMLLNRCLQ
ncbi:MAG: hypothetical protein R2867_19430 [Caldilineaceae bacterium]